MAKVKISVIKKMNTKDIFGSKPPVKINKEMLTPECPCFQEGQEFIIDSEKFAPDPESWQTCPPNFCSWAYGDIQRDIASILFGGSYPWIEDKGTIISCCTDGLRPVVFKIERIEN
jgi:uncharacterized repeat protein (TIGR04076 family)